MPPFLLEIGTAEIPDWMIPGALEHLEQLFTESLAKHRLSHEALELDATPRRLVVRCKGIDPMQKASESLVTGPPVSAAFKNGEPTPAAHAFAKKMNTDVASLARETTPKGEYLAFTQRIEGAPAASILAEALPGLILSIPFPKNMVWAGKGTSRFIRPIRWLVALLGEEVVPFAIEGVKSGNRTEGHRRLGKRGLAVNCSNYEGTLRGNGVILRAEERRKQSSKARKQCRGEGVRYHSTRNCSTLVYITEFPTAILGSFAEEYLPARGSADHRDAAPPEVFRRTPSGWNAGAALCGGDEHGGRSRRAGGERQ